MTDGAQPTTKQLIERIEASIIELARGTASDFNTMSDESYTRCSEKCGELSRYLDSIAESFLIAASPECTALLALICDKMENSNAE